MSEASISQIHHWSENCTRSHQACSARQEAISKAGVKSPTRLIDLHGSQAKTWNIIITTGTPTRYKYVALSHRWTRTVPKLERKVFDQFQAGQPDNMLPMDYQHVISLCRALSIRYLWVDSLCILQDSVEDFHCEAATMVDVYMGALFTMSICWPSESGGLPIRDPSTMIPKLLLPATNGSGREEVALVYNEDEWRDCVSKAPINRRGWVFQERVLSSRILYLAKEQFYWECDDMRACEVYPDGMPPSNSDSRVNVADEALSNDTLNDIWDKIVEDYTLGSLTFQKDKLVALSGVARQVASMSGDKYVAGLWKSRLILDLLWYVDDTRYPDLESGKRQSDCNAPSWSWASKVHPVRMALSFKTLMHHSSAREVISFAKSFAKPLARIEDASVLSSGPDEFGDISSASISLRCLMFFVDIPEPGENSSIGFRRVHHTSSHVDSGSLVSQPLGQGQPKSDQSTMHFMAGENRVVLDGPFEKSLPTFFIPLTYTGEERRADNTEIHGLIIQSLQQAGQPHGGICEKEEFRRIGMVSIYQYSELFPDDDDYFLLRVLILNTFLQLIPTHQPKAGTKHIGGGASDEMSKREEQQLVFESRLRTAIQAVRAGKSRVDTEDYLDARWSSIRLV
ncbi:hypothetical protein Hte_002355 [Hypoxylon texense]